MSLFSEEEICKGCRYSVFHDCCEKFCHCKIGSENKRNACHGKCDEHTGYNYPVKEK